MGDPGATLEILILLTGAAVVVLGLGFMRRAPEWLEFLIGASAGFQALQLGGRIHLFTMLCFLYLVVANRKGRPHRGRSIALMSAIGLLILSVPLGTLAVNSSEALQLLALAAGSVIIAMKATDAAIDRMLYGLLTVCTFAAVVAVAQRTGLLAYEPLLTSGFERSAGIYTEPDWLGLFSAVGLVIAARLPMQRVIRAGALTFLGAALLISFARAAWLALAIVVLASMLVSIWRALLIRHPGDVAHRTRLGAIVVLSIGIVGLAVTNFTFVTHIADRVSITNTSSDRSAAVRRHQYSGLEQLAAEAPWHGLGLSSSGRVSATGPIRYGEFSEDSVNAPNIVATNWVLGWWVDGKYLAVPIILLLCGLAVVTVGTTPGLILLLALVSSLFSNVILLPITWLAVGMALAQLPSLSALRAWLRKPRERPGLKAGFEPPYSRPGTIYSRR